jgi:hypothetical protein
MANITVKYLGVTTVMAQSGQNKAASAAGAVGGAWQQNPPVDSRIIEAIIRAVYRYDSFVLKYGWIEKELRSIVGNENELRVLEEKMYEHLMNGEIKNVSMVYYHEDAVDNNVVVVAPCKLTKEQWYRLEDLADMYDYAGYEDPTAFKYDLVVKYDRPSIDIVMHNLVRAWCVMRYIDDNAREVYNAFKASYGLEKSFEEITKDVEP